MFILFILGFFFIFLSFPFIRILVLNLFPFILLTVKDLFNYFKDFKFNVCPSGKIVCFAGLFGYGKTLSAVHHVCHLYRRYNGKKCFINGHWRVQHIIVLSNVALTSIPYVPFKSLSQVTYFAQNKDRLDSDNHYFVFLVLGDEFSTCLNSRSFKSNIDPIFLNTLVTCRHYAISLFYTSQRFNLVDKLLRDVTFWVYQCRKVGRIELLNKYDAYDLENALNPSLIKPISRGGWLIRDKDYDSYDTLAVVDNLIKSSQSSDYSSENEIINRIYQGESNINAVRRFSNKVRRAMRKNKK